MARPKTHHERRISTAIRVPESLHDRLVEAAHERHMSVNHLVVLAVGDYLSRLIPVDELRLTRQETPND